MSHRVIAEQPIMVHCGRTRMLADAIRKGASHPIAILAKRLGEEWARSQDILPAIIKLKVVVKRDVVVLPDHVKQVKDEIVRIIESLPADHQEFYQRILEKLNDPTEEMDVPRLIEYLTMVSTRYILDCIRKDRQDFPTIALSGLTFSSKTVGDRSESEVWISHNCSSQDIDALFGECSKLAVALLKTIVGNKGQMNLLKILNIKCQSDEYVPPFEGQVVVEKPKKGRGFGSLIQRLKSLHVLILNITSGHI